MHIHLCKNDETLEQALEFINANDSEGRKFTCDKEKDRCYVGDEAFVSAPWLVNHKNQYWALHEIKK